MAKKLDKHAFYSELVAKHSRACTKVPSRQLKTYRSAAGPLGEEEHFHFNDAFYKLMHEEVVKLPGVTRGEALAAQFVKLSFLGGLRSQAVNPKATGRKGREVEIPSDGNVAKMLRLIQKGIFLTGKLEVQEKLKSEPENAFELKRKLADLEKRQKVLMLALKKRRKHAIVLEDRAITAFQNQIFELHLKKLLPESVASAVWHSIETFHSDEARLRAKIADNRVKAN